MAKSKESPPIEETVTSDAPDTLLPPEDAEEEKEIRRYFPLIVDVFDGKLPGQDGYDPTKDRLLIGFKFGNKTPPPGLPMSTKIEEVTAYDLLTNPVTGLRAGHEKEPWGTGQTDLTGGVGDYVNLPPVEIWARGEWLADAIWDIDFDIQDLPFQLRKDIEDSMVSCPSRGIPHELWNLWLTSGEGTPTNDLYKLFKLPKEQASKVKPQHPVMWPDSLKKPKYTSGYSSGYGSTYATKTTPTTPAAPAKPTLPAGVRMRCPGCGHWFKMDDLVSHDKVCGKGDDADWAIMCDPACGCRNLHDASTPMPGFPRPKPEPAAKAEVPELPTNGAAESPAPSAA